MRRSTVLGTIAAAAAAGSAPAVVAQALRVVRLGATISDPVIPAVYAQQAGLFRRAGLDVQLIPMANGAAATAAVLGGSLELATGNMVAIATAHEREVPLQIASPGSVYNAKAPVVLAFALSSSGIKRPRDLSGKVFASGGLTDLNMVTALTLVAKDGGDPDSIRKVELPIAAQLAALDAGRIDAGILLAPLSQEARFNPKYRVIMSPYDAVAPAFANGVYLATTPYITANAETIERFARTVREASIYANAHHAETALLLADAMKMDPEQVKRFTRESYFESLDVQKFQVCIDFFATHKILKASFPAQDMISAPAIAAWR
jgi:NitT/TauT family transport system substrate-binding protein